MSNKTRETGNTVLSNVRNDDSPTPGVEWADLMKFGLMALSVPKRFGTVGESVTYQTKAGKLLTCAVSHIIGDSSDGKSVFVLAQLPPKESRKTVSKEDREAEKTATFLRNLKLAKEQGLI